MFRRLRQTLLAGDRGRRLICLLLLGSLCAAFVPLPVVRPTTLKDTSTPYPCQDRPCGCRSAEECWRSCCCFSNAEKVAWAQSHGVEVPAFVVAAAAEERENSGDRPTCCAGHGRRRSCCDQSADQWASQPAACSSEHATTGDCHDAGELDADQVKYVIGVYAQKCQGQGAYDLVAGWVLLPPSPPLALPHAVTGRPPLQNQFPCGLPPRPPLPPPRLG